MRIPPDIRIKSTIKAGSVYYFVEESIHSNEPHNFIVINKDPLNDPAILLVCCSSQLEIVKRRSGKFPGTLVEISAEQYSGFTKSTIVNCNFIIEKTIESIIDKLRTGQLKAKAEIDMAIVEEIRTAVRSSPLIERYIKLMIS